METSKGININFDSMIQSNVNLLAYNTFGIGVHAKHFARFERVDELKSILKNCHNEEILILGGGSNILFTKDFNGIVLKNEIKGFTIIEENENDVIVESGAGENWHQFVLKCIDHNFCGLENLSLIPGSVGASPMQNIGAYGVEIKDVFEKLQAYHIPTGEVHEFKHSDCEFGYRESVFKRKFKDQYVILNVSFKLSKKSTINSSYGAIENELDKMGISNPTIRNISDAVIAIRSSKLPDPKIIGNAGSFFKNPVVSKSALLEIQKSYPEVPFYTNENNEQVKLPAGWLIEKAGWKGKRFNNFGVHKMQALVLVNYGEAKGTQILDLSEQIIKDISEKFGVTLEREVNIL
jgi:UDP-N-acetylmuramate dehydrogenase